MAAELGGPVVHLCGIPFLDAGFDQSRLLAAVAAVRLVEAEKAGRAAGARSTAAAEACLAPTWAYTMRGGDGAAMPAAPLSADCKHKITDVLSTLATTMPGWEPLVGLPVRYALLRPANGAVSASSRAWPQHVLIAEDGFENLIELRELLVHELAHQWLYLIQELWPLQPGHIRHLALPSGTSSRSPAEVLGAAHVAAALICLYTEAVDGPTGRAGQLAAYGAGCLALLTDTDLTDAGRQVARRLKEAF